MAGRRAGRARGTAAAAAAVVTVALAVVAGGAALRLGWGAAAPTKHELPLPSAYWEPAVSMGLKSGPEGAALVEAWVAEQPAGRELHVLFEMYSSWCPRCKKFRPQYNMLARVFNPGGSGEKAGVLVAHMACDQERAACRRLGAEGYPGVVWTTPAKVRTPPPPASPPPPPRFQLRATRARAAVADAEYFRLQLARLLKDEDAVAARGDLKDVLAPREAQGVLDWVNGRLKSRFWLVPWVEQEPMKDPYSTTGAGMDKGHADFRDMETSVMLSVVQVAELAEKSGNAAKLREWVSLIAEVHPSRQCRTGAKTILEKVPATGDDHELTDIVTRAEKGEVCNNKKFDPSTASWGSCRGATRSSRGYTCGLWMTFHAMSLNAEKMGWGGGNGGAKFLGRIKSFVRNFFACDECRTHFLQMTEKQPFKKARTHQEAILWLWRAHNEVNERLSEEEAADAQRGETSENPRKVQYPTRELCPQCYTDASGDTFREEEVLAFLDRYYGAWPVPDGMSKSGNRQGGGYSIVALAALAVLALLHFGGVLPSQGRSRKVDRYEL